MYFMWIMCYQTWFASPNSVFMHVLGMYLKKDKLLVHLETNQNFVQVILFSTLIDQTGVKCLFSSQYYLMLHVFFSVRLTDKLNITS